MRYCPRNLLRACACLACLLAAACAAPPKEVPPPAPPPVAVAPPEPIPVLPPEVELPPVPLVLVSPDELPLFEDDLDFAGLAEALQRSIEYYEQCGRTFEIGKRKFSCAEMADGLRDFAALIESRPSAGGLCDAIREYFDVYASVANETEGGVLFTGYYEPLIEGSRRRTETYRWPLYEKPADMISVDLGLFRNGLAGERLMARLEGKSLLPYYSRQEIDGQGRLMGRGRELVWARDPVDVFFLQIQGSGRVIFEDGTQTRVHYVASNGRAFRSIGRLLVEEGRLPRGGVSMQAVRHYLTSHPEEAEAILNHNESYVFFEEVAEGPLGNIGVVLTPGRSVATDYKLFPGGALAWVASRKPVIRDGQIVRWERFGRFVMNQDTGGVIRGPGRVDFFWGSGPEAELAAGSMCESGKLYFLVSKRLLPEPVQPAAEVGENPGSGRGEGENGELGAEHNLER
jgi:membrane-bound lytic murein transglycosylase A